MASDGRRCRRCERVIPEDEVEGHNCTGRVDERPMKKRDAHPQHLYRGEIIEVVPMELPGRGILPGDPPQVHDLKCWPSAFRPTVEGRKNFEFRKADRDYQRGDILRLREWSPVQERYLGASCEVEVTYVLRGPKFGVPEGYCVMSFAPVQEWSPGQTSAQEEP